jgi:hypothetical protein
MITLVRSSTLIPSSAPGISFFLKSFIGGHFGAFVAGTASEMGTFEYCEPGPFLFMALATPRQRSMAHFSTYYAINSGNGTGDTTQGIVCMQHQTWIRAGYVTEPGRHLLLNRSL